MLDKESKILITGRYGQVGSAVERALHNSGYNNIIGCRSRELDLRDGRNVMDYFDEERPDFVVAAAAKVGGIQDNIDHPADFLIDNLEIQNNIIRNSFRHHVKKLIFIASNCIYPDNVPNPIKEDCFMSGKLNGSNEGYGIAKLAGVRLCDFYNRQYGTDYLSLVASNIYGIGDDFAEGRAHVVPAMIRRLYQAKLDGDKSFPVWGTGNARRELMYVDDLASAVVFSLEKKIERSFVNVGYGNDVSIRELVSMTMDVVGYHPEPVFDSSKPEGNMQKLLDSSYMNHLGWHPKTDLSNGLKKTFEHYLESLV